MGHLTEMGDHRVRFGLQFATVPICSGCRSGYGWEIGPRCGGSEIARQCGAAVRQERPSGQPGGLFLVLLRCWVISSATAFNLGSGAGVLARAGWGAICGAQNRNVRGPGMGRVHFAPKAFAGFVFFLIAFGFLISIDRGSGAISRAWPILMLVYLAAGTFAIYRRMWQARNNSDEIRGVEARGLYGVLPTRLRNWLFP